MRVRKTTPEQEQREKEEYFRSLTGEERLRITRIINDRFRKRGINYELQKMKVQITRGK
ncbi:MAG TPA: hypothetical protein VFU05_08120 [Cyclobacteriaceae bacterium]|nr:hypothetical protein [Cyclobacteriaceae bacterium]